jgi:hypothetical protein
MSRWRLAAAILLGCALATSIVGAQTAASPTNTQCKQWDNAYLLAVNLGILVAPLVVIFLGLLVFPFFSGRFWLMTRPVLRLITATAAGALLLALTLVPWSVILGVGTFWFPGIDPSYAACGPKPFNPTGLLYGSVGQGVAAILLGPAMLLLLLGGSILGGFLGLLIGWWRVRRSGLWSLVPEIASKGEGS